MSPRSESPRILFLPWDEATNASARCRIYDLAGWLAQRGFDTTVLAPVGGPLGERLRRPGAAPGARRAAYRLLQWLKRGRRLERARGADVVVLQRELFPFGPPSLERSLLARARVIYDVDDALHVRPAHFRRWSHRLHRFDKAQEIAARAEAVVVASRALEEWARPLARRVVLVPTPVDVDRYRPRERPAGSPLVVGWTGTAGNLAHLGTIRPALLDAFRQVPFVLRVIGERPLSWADPPVEFIPWSLEGEAASVPLFDVGLMPLADSEYSRAKAGYKALVYMAAGVPPLVSPVGTNCEILSDGAEGFFASTREEWTDRLVRLLRDGDLRRRLGAAARARVVAERSQEAVFPRWLELLRGLYTAPGNPALAEPARGAGSAGRKGAGGEGRAGGEGARREDAHRGEGPR